MPERGGEHAARALLHGPRDRVAELGPPRARHARVELLGRHPEQHAGVGPQVAELVHLVVPAPRRAEMRRRRMVRVGDLEVHRLVQG